MIPISRSLIIVVNFIIVPFYWERGESFLYMNQNKLQTQSLRSILLIYQGVSFNFSRSISNLDTLKHYSTKKEGSQPPFKLLDLPVQYASGF